MSGGTDLNWHINLQGVDVIEFPTFFPIYKNLVFDAGKKNLILEEIINALLSFNMRKKVGGRNSQGEGLVLRSNQKYERNRSQNELRNNEVWSKSRKRKDIQCYKCGKIEIK
ncbi:Retrovirus-related polyprotein from transposon [Salix suchowensis]|nr:Retrovirus-related polyprotein from transposon [Salix suchowensis]